jgi:putative nucleotidyltransferase with HDIG domain
MLPPPKAPLTAATEFFKRSDVWARVGMCILVTTALWGAMFGWAPPFQYRARQAPVRDVHANTAFEFRDIEATDAQKRRVQRNIRCFYVNDKQPLEQLRQALIDDVFAIKQKTFEEISNIEVWDKFFPDLGEKTAGNTVGPVAPPRKKFGPSLPPELIATAEVDSDGNPIEQPQEAVELSPRETELLKFRNAFENDEELAVLREAVNKAFIEIDRNGLLESLTHDIGQGSLEEIDVYPKGDVQSANEVKVSDVRIAEVVDDLKKRLTVEISKESERINDGVFVAETIFDWLRPQLPVTLTWDEPTTVRETGAAIREVETVMKRYEPGDALEQFNGRDIEKRGIKAGVPLNDVDIEILQAEYRALVQSEPWSTRLLRSIGFFGLFAAVFSMLCQYLYYRDRHLLDDFKQFATLLGMVFVTLTSAWLLTINLEWRAEVIPIVMLSMTIAIAYHVELALMLSALVCLAFTVTHGYGIGEFVILTTASATAAMNCRQIRSRTKLVNIGLVSALIVFPSVMGVQYLIGQPFNVMLLTNALLFAGGTFFAGLLMTGLLPFMERWFEIQTDISLLELSDANHPLLKELVQRAPGTYNHSINVASISEAAAEAIGANGLLCRVGAYFHDVGKLRKPEYFIENQAGGENKHDDLTPTMSTLVIVAHVKDGVEIARQHRLPSRIIDLIEQHHGNTMVEYFYNRALKNAEQDEDKTAAIDKADFRYPGPRPQTTEAAVMMLADTVESASRALREPTPARIENLVTEITRKKLEDGQFDHCKITIEQLNTIRQSLIKSLNAMYHARVKYPDQPPAKSKINA